SLIEYLLGFKPKATYTNENNLSTFLLFVTPFLLSEIILKMKIKRNVILLALIFITVHIAEARLGQLAFIIQLTAFFFIFMKVNKVKGRKLFLIILTYLVILSSPVVLWVITKETTGETIAQQLNRTGSSINIRIHMIKEGIRLFKESNFMGVGAGNIIIQDVWNPEIERKQSLHFFIVTLLASYGIISAVLFIYMHIRLFKIIKFMRDNSDFIKFLKSSLIIFLISFLIVANLPSTLIDFRPFYFFFGYFFAFIRVYKKKYS
ncbi:O-antigen ligase family protein, partial [Bacillus sp. JJ1562]|uniref:O-antigen ligase family protein n=1 Tax=Bacillus sp. JJ1562 TaxID=3122960 RepID=UPI003002F8AA